MPKKLPIGISTLKTIIEEDYAYVDKTETALKMITGSSRYLFLSRPRRFGKSLFLDTLRMIFDGERELFKGLHIYDKHDFDKHPIIRISFNSGDFSSKEAFHKRIFAILDDNQQDLGVTCPQQFASADCFGRLIKEAHKKYNKKVVILVDEYDKPILDNIDNKETATIIRDELRNFYSVIKGADEYLKFVFITGVSKFSKVSLFSGLNNINDITLDKRYATLCGYTQNDVETVFKNHLQGQDFGRIKKWYNGYKWLGEGGYNPFDILLFIDKGFEYRNYWFSTATPTFLLKLIEKNNYFLPKLENIVKDEMMLNSFDVDYIELETLMWQTGYLTIDKTTVGYDGMPKYHLAVPNQEVKILLLSCIADFITKNNNSKIDKENIYESLLETDFNKLKTALVSLYASIAYNNFTENNRMYEYEGYYVNVFYSYIKALGINTVAEDVTNKGRIDITLNLPNAIYVMEFKVDGDSALDQIKQMKYYEKYLSSRLPVYIVGIEFSKEERNVVNMAWEQV